MAQIKAYPKGSTEPIEWTLNPDADAEEVGVAISNAGPKTMVNVRTADGWALIDPFSFAAFEVIP